MGGNAHYRAFPGCGITCQYNFELVCHNDDVFAFLQLVRRKVVKGRMSRAFKNSSAKTKSKEATLFLFFQSAWRLPGSGPISHFIPYQTLWPSSLSHFTGINLFKISKPKSISFTVKTQQDDDMADDYELVKTLTGIVNNQMKKDSATAICKCLDMYVMLLSKIEENPGDTKYQSIKKSSKLVAGSIGSVSGGMDLLYKIGWVVQVKDFEEWIVWKGNMNDLQAALSWVREKSKSIQIKATQQALAADTTKNEEAKYLAELKDSVDKERKQRYHS